MLIKGKGMTGVKAIKEYARLCFLANREPNEAEFLGMVMFGILPEWIEAS